MDIPQELVCNLCEKLIEKAVVLPCCAGSVCLDCGQSALGKKSACPLGDCLSEGVYSDELIPNRRLRQKASDLREKMKDDEVESGDPVVESTTNDDQKTAPFLDDASLVESTTHDDEDNNNLSEDYVEKSRDGEQRLDNVSSEIEKVSNSSPLEGSNTQEKSDKDVEEGKYSACQSKTLSDVSGAEVEKPPDEKTEKEPSSENVPDQIKTTYGDHSVSIPSEYLNVAKEDPLAAFQKLMEVKDKQKGITDSTQYYGVPPSSLYPDYVNQYPYPLYRNHYPYTPSPYFTGDPYGGAYGVPGSFPNYSGQYRDKRHHYSQRDSRKYSSYSEHSSSETRHSSARYEKANNYEERKRSQDRSSKASYESTQRKHREHRSRKKNYSSSPSKSDDRKAKKSKKNDRKSVTRDESKNHHKKEKSTKCHSSSQGEQESKLQKESLKKKKNSVSSSSDDSSSSESSSSSSSDSSSSEDKDSSSLSSLSSGSSHESSSKRTKKRKTHKKYQPNKKKLMIKEKKSEGSRALDKIIEEHSKNVDTLVDKKKKKSKRRKLSV